MSFSFAAAIPLLLALTPIQGADRVDALEERLVEASEEQLTTVLGEAFEVFLEEAEALHLERAERLALAMHARARAPWSALTLALLSTRAGFHDQADRVLADQLARTPVGPEQLELLERRGLAALAAGRERAARHFLGEALLRGGVDAHQVLGRIALARGESARARRLFGALLVPRPPAASPSAEGAAPWALRGWGLAMLPASPDPVAASARRSDPLTSNPEPSQD